MNAVKKNPAKLLTLLLAFAIAFGTLQFNTPAASADNPAPNALAASPQLPDGTQSFGFIADQPTLTSPDNGKALCTLDKTFFVVTHLAGTDNWKAKIGYLENGTEIKYIPISSDSIAKSVTVGPFDMGENPLYFLAEIDGTILYDEDGIGFDWDTQTVEFEKTIEPIRNAVLFWGVPSPEEPRTVKFTVSADVHEHNGSPCAGDLTYTWNFGDGGTSVTNTNTITHTYAGMPGEDGKFTASVTIRGARGGAASASRIVLAGHPIQAPEDVCDFETIPVTVTNKDFNGSQWTAKYSVLDGNTEIDSRTLSFNNQTGTDEIGPFADLISDHLSSVGTSKDITIKLTEIGGAVVDYDITVKVFYWLRSINHTMVHQLFDDPFSFQFTPQIVTHCDCDTIMGYQWHITNSAGASNSTLEPTDRNPTLTFDTPQLTLSNTWLEITTSSGRTYKTSSATQGNSVIGFTDPDLNPLLTLSNSVICRYESPKLSVTNRNFIEGTPWSVEISDNASAWTYTNDNIATKSIIVPVDLGSDPALGGHILTVTVNPGQSLSSVASATITVVKAVTADFYPVVTPGSLSVNFIATVDLHHPTTGGSGDCAGVGANTKTYEWTFDTGENPVGETSLYTPYTYLFPGTKSVTFDVYDKFNVAAASVTKPITLTAEEGGSKFDVLYYPGTTAVVSNMPANDIANAGEQYTISPLIPRRFGYTFTGWLASFNITYQPSHPFTMPASSVALSAQWLREDNRGGGDPDPPKKSEDEENPDNEGDPDNPYNNIVITGSAQAPLAFLENGDHIRYLNGYPNMTVRPDKNMTRAEVAAIFYRLLPESEKKENLPQAFTDVPDDAWYSPHVNCLASLGVINGYPDGAFQPDASVTRAEFATISSRFDEMYLTTGTAFMDVPEDHWAVQYINAGYINKWLNGYEDYSFKPDNNITRAEVVKIVNRILNRLPQTLPDDINPYTDISDTHWAYIHIIEASIYHDYERDDNDIEFWTKVYERNNYLA